MPIYEYLCSACGHAFDKRQKMSDDPIKVCPQCGKETVEKLISAAGFQLKGTGWYETDFKNKPKADASSQTDKKDTKKETKKPESTSKKTGTSD